MANPVASLRHSCAGAVAFVVGLVGCTAAEPGDRLERADSAGVEIVTNPALDRPAPFTLEREWILDGTTGPELGEIVPWHVAADAEGVVYVLDDPGKRVLVLDAAGEARDTLGRPGEGPGELSTPVAIHVGTDGTVGVWDYGKGGLLRWRHGEPLPLQRVKADFWGADVRFVGGRVAFVAMLRDALVRQRLVVGDSAATGSVAELPPREPRPAEFPSCGINGIPIPPLFGLELNWDLAGDRIVASTSPSWEISVYDVSAMSGDGSTVPLRAVWRRDIPAREATEAMALREVGEGLRIPMNGCVVPPAEVVRGRGFEDYVPAIRRVVADHEGRVWVLRGGLQDEPNLVDVLDSTGAYLGTLPATAPVPVAFAGPDRLIGLETVDGVRYLASWRIVRSVD
jgi:hypothetical protein